MYRGSAVRMHTTIQIVSFTLAFAFCANAALNAAPASPTRMPTSPAQASGIHLATLESLSVEALRARNYGSSLHLEAPLGAHAYLVSFESDGLREYARVDFPAAPMPAAGYPVVLFLHGWMGMKAAPTLDFYVKGPSIYGRMIRRLAAGGFVVITPGYRGHGSVRGVPADGIEFLAAWDNGSYVSPAFYAIDVLNLLEGVRSIEAVDWPDLPDQTDRRVAVDTQRINVIGHSQGGDVALIVLAAAGPGSGRKITLAAGSIWSGTFVTPAIQLSVYGPMETSPQAFLAGNRRWNASPVGADGTINRNFVFAYPPDWIETPDPRYWTWQRKTWSNATVAAALTQKLDEMYNAFNEGVDDLRHSTYHLENSPDGRVSIVHDPRVAAALARLGAFDAERALTEHIALHHSDRDFYSWSAWNADLCGRINRMGGDCADFEYPRNTHSLEVSQHRWFSGAGGRAGFDLALRRDIELFRGGAAASVNVQE